MLYYRQNPIVIATTPLFGHENARSIRVPYLGLGFRVLLGLWIGARGVQGFQTADLSLECISILKVRLY